MTDGMGGGFFCFFFFFFFFLFFWVTDTDSKKCFSGQTARMTSTETLEAVRTRPTSTTSTSVPKRKVARQSVANPQTRNQINERRETAAAPAT